MSFLIRIRDLLLINAERWLKPKLAELPLRSAIDSGITGLKRLQRQLRDWTRPHWGTGFPVIGAIGDLRRSRPELVLENALLRKQLSILGRQVRRSRTRTRDRLAILTLARILPNWRDALLFVTNQHRQLWACDFVQVHDLLFRSIFAFFIVDVPTRRVVHAGVTRYPTDRWVAQQLREATAWGRAPKYLLLDNDNKFGVEFDALAVNTGIKLVHTAVHVPVMNSVCERFIGSVRRESLDHVVISGVL